MARARNIKPGLYKNEDLAECSVWARYIFPGLWMLADRAGRMEDRPKRIKGELAPYDAVDVDPLLDELAKFGFILRYRSEGQDYIQISKFSEHQTPHVKEAPSTIPAPDDTKSTIRQAPDKHKSTLGAAPPDCGVLIPDCGLPQESTALPPPKPAAGSQPKKLVPKGSRLPDDWKLPKPWGEWALTEKPEWLPEDVRQCSLSFSDYWHAKPGKDALKLDWLLVWRNWVRKETPGKPNGRASVSAVVVSGTHVCCKPGCDQLGLQAVSNRWHCPKHFEYARLGYEPAA